MLSASAGMQVQECRKRNAGAGVQASECRCRNTGVRMQVLERSTVRRPDQEDEGAEMERILIIEDDDVLAQGVKFNLELAGFAVDTASDLKEAKKKLDDACKTGAGSETGWQLLILDVNLPDGEGFAFAGSLRKECDVPVIFLTARDLDEDMMRGFETGADDYITKPFNVQILVQRVRAVLKRYRAGNEKRERIKAGNLEIDFQSWQVWKRGEELTLTPTEFKLLKKFCDNPGIVLTRAVLLETLWDKEENYVDEHTLTIFISRLRSKIADRDHTYIRTIYGTGYQWTGE